MRRRFLPALVAALVLATRISGHGLGGAAPAGRGQLRPADAGDGAEERRPLRDPVRRRAGGAGLQAPGRHAHALPGHPLARLLLRRAGAARDRVRPPVRDERPPLRQLHECARRHARRALPGERLAHGRPSQHPAAAVRPRPARVEPQRRPAPVRPERQAVHGPGRRGRKLRPRRARAEPAQPPREAPQPESPQHRRRLADRRLRSAEPVGVLLRPRQRAPVHR